MIGYERVVHGPGNRGYGLWGDAGSTLYQYPYSKNPGPFDLIQAYKRLCSDKGVLSSKT